MIVPYFPSSKSAVSIFSLSPFCTQSAVTPFVPGFRYILFTAFFYADHMYHPLSTSFRIHLCNHRRFVIPAAGILPDIRVFGPVFISNTAIIFCRIQPDPHLCFLLLFLLIILLLSNSFPVPCIVVSYIYT